MRNAIVTFILVLTASFFAYGFQASDWIDFSSDNGHFSISLPVKPEEQIQNSEIYPFDIKTKKNTSKKVGVISHSLTSLTAEGMYIIVWVDYDQSFTFDVAGELIANRDNFLKESGAKLTSEKKIKFGNNPGLEFTAEKSPNILVTSRIYIIGRRPFILATAMKSQGEQDSNVSKFFSSFKIMTKK